MQLLALDIDHTLTGDGHEITRTNAAAVKQAMECGVKVTVITGRRYALSAAVHAENLGLAGPIGCHYGRRLVDHPTGSVLSSHPLQLEVVRAVMDAARLYDEAIVSLFVGDELFFNSLPPDLKAGAGGLAQFAEGDLDKLVKTRAGEIMSVHVSARSGAAPVEAASEAVDRLFPGLVDRYYSPWAGNPGGLLTVISAAADKGTALIDIARRLGVDPSEAVAMGDSEADISMLQAAGIGVAMPWAEEAVLHAADLVADGDPEDAVARAIEALMEE